MRHGDYGRAEARALGRHRGVTGSRRVASVAEAHSWTHVRWTGSLMSLEWLTWETRWLRSRVHAEQVDTNEASVFHGPTALYLDMFEEYGTPRMLRKSVTKQ